MDDAKPNTLKTTDADLVKDLQTGNGKLCAKLEAAIGKGATVAVRQHDGETVFFDDADLFSDHICDLTEMAD